ncbi:hypothetical protein F5B20DRAFT_545785 [Whalleya microplaca]|nr:hypothetical protein F5B20DRAFT_545785 [Whalleya microplaca]
MTLACEQCRKRKVRCSGTAPCSNCHRHMQECLFDHNRRRRGPRPKRYLPAQYDAEAVSAPAPAQSPPPAPSRSSRPSVSSHGPITDRATPFSLDSIDAWRTGLIEIMGTDRYRVNGEFAVSTDQALHLVLVFFVTVNSQQCPVMSATAFLKGLESANVARHLCHSMCSVALRFSRHEASHVNKLDEGFAAEAREELASSEETSEHARLQQILTLSVLSMYETYRGNGLQAWHDITVALNLVTMFKYTQSTVRNDGISHGLQMAQQYLATSGILNSIGQQIQHSNLSLLQNLTPKDMLKPSLDNTSPNLLPGLTSLLRRCLALSRKDFTQAHPAPWSNDSQFMVLKEELDRFCILHTGELTLTEDLLESLQRTDAGAGEYILWFSMLYSMRMLLNRAFMPIGVNPTGNSDVQSPHGNNNTPESANQKSSRQPTSPRKALFFPGAPNTFCRERVAACVRSARSVTLLCQSILGHGTFLLPPFLGYALFLAGLVFLNQLHIEEDPNRLEEFIDHLKTIFTVLGTMRFFFTPAHLWVDTLFRVHALDLVSESLAVTGNPAKLFSNFFIRFPGISEPPYCSMHPTQSHAVHMRSSSSSKPNDDTINRTPRESLTALQLHGDNVKEFNNTDSAENNRESGVNELRKGGKATANKAVNKTLGDYSRAIDDIIRSMTEEEVAREDLEPIRLTPTQQTTAQSRPITASSSAHISPAAAAASSSPRSVLGSRSVASHRVEMSRSPQFNIGTPKSQQSNSYIKDRTSPQSQSSSGKANPEMDLTLDSFLYNNNNAFTQTAKDIDCILSLQDLAMPADMPMEANLGFDDDDGGLGMLLEPSFSAFLASSAGQPRNCTVEGQDDSMDFNAELTLHETTNMSIGDEY